MPDSIKREFRIDSSDAAKPPAQLETEARYYAQGLKPKPRVIVDVNYEELDEYTMARKDCPSVRLVLKTTTYDDGVLIDTTVGELNEGYLAHKRGEARKTDGNTGTRKRQPTKKPTAPKAASKKG